MGIQNLYLGTFLDPFHPFEWKIFWTLFSEIFFFLGPEKKLISGQADMTIKKNSISSLALEYLS
jgi:hypothetical protein